MGNETEKLTMELNMLEQEVNTYKTTIDELVKEITSLNATMEAMADRQNHPIKAMAKNIGESLTQMKDSCARTYERATGYLKNAKDNLVLNAKEDATAVRDTLHDFYKKEVSACKGLFQKIKDKLTEMKEFVKSIPDKLRDTKENVKDAICDMKDKFWVKSGLANHELKDIDKHIAKAQDKIAVITGFDRSMFEAKQGFANAFRSLQGKSPVYSEYVMSESQQKRVQALSVTIENLKLQKEIVKDRIALTNGIDLVAQAREQEAEFEK